MKKQWWHNKVAYQIWPKSFYDTNDDGIGDIPGIIEKLDYLKELGVDIIWISPMYQSPMVDQGYDISDYYAIHPSFGTMEDMERLLAETKKRDMHILMDLVVNHCSDQHEWFKKAMENPEGEYGRYFYILDGKDGNPPNNWRAAFGGSCWEKIPGYENKFYFHTFAKEQPDLNWENPALREEIYRMINWWLDKGISGFRIDALINMKKDLSWESLVPDMDDGMATVFLTNQKMPGIELFLQELRDKCFKPHNAFTVGEVFNLSKEKTEEFIGDDGYISTFFDFGHCSVRKNGIYWADSIPFDFKKWRSEILNNQEFTKDIAYEANIIENHDQPRGAGFFIPEEDYCYESVTALATIMILLRGLPFLYQGQEIGMRNWHVENIEEYDDISTKGEYRTCLAKGFSEKEALQICYENSRDNARTPMQWSGEEHGGFTRGTPWLRVNPNYSEINVAANELGEKTILKFYRKLLALRKNPEYEDILITGTLEPAYTEEEHVFAYYRVNEADGRRWLIFSNYQNTEQEYILTENVGNILLNNCDTLEKTEKGYRFFPYQTVVWEVLD